MKSIVVVNGERDWQAFFPGLEVHFRRVQASRVDDEARAQRQLARAHDVSRRATIHRGHRGAERDGTAVPFQVPLQRQHQPVAVDDAGRGRQQRGLAAQLRLERNAARRQPLVPGRATNSGDRAQFEFSKQMRRTKRRSGEWRWAS